MRQMSKFWKNKYCRAGISILVLFILLAVCVPLVSSFSPTEQNVALQNLGSSPAHPFGTDKFGRDIFVRVWYGAGISLLVGVLGAVICALIGVCYGGISGYAGKKTDLILMRIVDIIDAVPSLLYVILIMLVLGASVGSVILGICISGWTKMARVVRGEVKRLEQMDFALAARLTGAGGGHILWKHLLPCVQGTILVNLTFLVPEAIFTEAFLSFLGVGIAAPAASLGTLIREAKNQMRIYPGQMLWPMLVLCMLILAFYLIAAGMEQEIGKIQEG